jgi:hypothetical protein
MMIFGTLHGKYLMVLNFAKKVVMVVSFHVAKKLYYE